MGADHIAMLVASHDSTHAELTIAAVQAAGKPVLCEKPLAPTVSECDRVLEAVGSATSTSGATPPATGRDGLRSRCGIAFHGET
jgi:hypothetical protein